MSSGVPPHKNPMDLWYGALKHVENAPIFPPHNLTPG
jgi:hypothetical protein